MHTLRLSLAGTVILMLVGGLSTVRELGEDELAGAQSYQAAAFISRPWRVGDEDEPGFHAVLGHFLGHGARARHRDADSPIRREGDGDASLGHLDALAIGVPLQPLALIAPRARPIHRRHRPERRWPPSRRPGIRSQFFRPHRAHRARGVKSPTPWGVVMAAWPRASRCVMQGSHRAWATYDRRRFHAGPWARQLGGRWCGHRLDE